MRFFRSEQENVPTPEIDGKCERDGCMYRVGTKTRRNEKQRVGGKRKRRARIGEMDRRALNESEMDGCTLTRNAANSRKRSSVDLSSYGQPRKSNR